MVLYSIGITRKVTNKALKFKAERVARVIIKEFPQVVIVHLRRYLMRYVDPLSTIITKSSKDPTQVKIISHLIPNQFGNNAWHGISAMHSKRSCSIAPLRKEEPYLIGKKAPSLQYGTRKVSSRAFKIPSDSVALPYHEDS